MAGFLSLSWNNHSLAFLNLLNSLHSKELYCDVTIACHGKFYPVHRMVLSTCSEYFQEIFALTQCKHPFIIVNDAQPPELEALLEYMYKGNINVPQSNLPTLLKAAEALRIKGLAVPDNLTPDREVSKKRGSSQNSGSKKLKIANKEKRNDPVRSSPDDRGRETPTIFVEDKEESTFKEESLSKNEVDDESMKRLGQEDPSNSIIEPLVKSEPFDSPYSEEQVVSQDGLQYSNNTEWPVNIGETHEDNQQSHSLIEDEEFVSTLEEKIFDTISPTGKDSRISRTKLEGISRKDQSTSTSTCLENKNPFISKPKESLNYSAFLSQTNAVSSVSETKQRIQARANRFKIRVISNPWVKRYCKSMFETHTEEKDPLYSQINLGYLGYFD